MFLTSILLLGMTVCVYSETCPSPEEIEPCTCERMVYSGKIMVSCTNENGDLKLGDLAHPIKSLAGKEDVWFFMHSFDLSKAPLDLFKGIGVMALDIYNCALSSVTEDNQKILDGLENSLKVLVIHRSITKDLDLSKLRFGHMQKLRQLYFARNSIKEITDTWFDNSKLDNITLIDNDIEEIGDRSFASLPKLKFLVLTGNRFGSFKRSMLPSSAISLRALLLADNGFTELPEDMFNNMPSLSFLSLEGNEISRLDQGTWEPVWENLDTLELNDNPLICDSHMDWTFDLRTPRRVLGTCDSPAEKKGEYLEDFINKEGK